MMRHWLTVALSGFFMAASAQAADFTRLDVAAMHDLGVCMALVGETEKPYVVPAALIPARLVETETLNFSGKCAKTSEQKQRIKDLSVVPEWLGKFNKMRDLNLSGTQIPANSALRNALGNMPHLEFLNLSDNPSLFSADGTGLTGVWDKLPDLRYLYLGNTGGRMSDYGSMVGLKNLLKLDLSHNKITGSPMSGLPTPSLTELDLSGNSSIRIEKEYGDPLASRALQKGMKLKVDDDADVADSVCRKLGMSCGGGSASSSTDSSDKEADTMPSSRESSSRSSGQYRINGDGTVTDTKTDLMWKQCSEGQSGDSCSGKVKEYKWDDAMSKFDSGVSFAGHSDWRMPTREELRSLVYCSNGTPQEEAWDESCSGKDSKAGKYESPTINQTAFPNTARWYWSSTEGDASDAWAVDFDDGDGTQSDRDGGGAVRLVRSGQ